MVDLDNFSVGDGELHRNKTDLFINIFCCAEVNIFLKKKAEEMIFLFRLELWEQGRRLNPLFLIMSQTSYHILYPATKWSECPFKGNLTQEWAHASYNTSA